MQAKAELVIVAGLSGAGKTTFLRQLKANELPREILAQLPNASRTWPVRVWPKKTDSEHEVSDSRLRRLVLHLALNTLGVESRRNDLLDLIVQFDRVTVVNIIAPRDRLVRQLKERSFEDDRFTRLILKLVNPRHVSVPWILKLPVLGLLEFRQRKSKNPETPRKVARILSRLDTYAHHPERLEEAERGLKQVLRSASIAGIEIKQVCIEPEPNPQNEASETYQWRQVEG